jgi:molybdopterin molybdotransferase
MIQVEEALSIIANHSNKMPVKKIKVSQSLGYIIAETIYAPIDMPPFRQSAMDGYGFIHDGSTQFEVIKTIQAGDYNNVKIKKNQAVRIFTGAFVPDLVDTVIMQEHVECKDNTIEIIKMPSPLVNIRKKGEQILKNDIVLEKGVLITPAAIGFLACLGITSIMVYAKPKVAIIVTGNELVKPGSKLGKGKIFESNSLMLESVLQQSEITKVKTFYTKDTLLATKKIIKKTLLDFDVVLVSGGISVGDYDFVKEALLLNGVEELFYKINQKPGKPLFFGKKKEKIVFALPGNPASSLTCFYVYALPALKKRMGFEAIHLPKIKRKIKDSFENTTGKALFLKASFDDKIATVLDSQSSAMLNTFSVANGFICIPFDTTTIKKEAEVTIIPFNT